MATMSRSPETLRFLEIGDVPGMQHVEAAVGHDDDLVPAMRLLDERQEFLFRDESPTALPSTVQGDLQF